MFGVDQFAVFGIDQVAFAIVLISGKTASRAVGKASHRLIRSQKRRL